MLHISALPLGQMVCVWKSEHLVSVHDSMLPARLTFSSHPLVYFTAVQEQIIFHIALFIDDFCLFVHHSKELEPKKNLKLFSFSFQSTNCFSNCVFYLSLPVLSSRYTLRALLTAVSETFWDRFGELVGCLYVYVFFKETLILL